ncbi:hypothetical protein L3Y34_009512 [Caenorhabditis briggsae]|uniref:Uncharacterized protein n=1 Tax=Caenorhabditis briggsae TaxID=6238 RepID=A0AAE9AAC5_CAEBR|nr:hypothetical protein L3Y34_009512 [Caenorhabditis briggsae]
MGCCWSVIKCPCQCISCLLTSTCLLPLCCLTILTGIFLFFFYHVEIMRFQHDTKHFFGMEHEYEHHQ